MGLLFGCIGLLDGLIGIVGWVRSCQNPTPCASKEWRHHAAEDIGYIRIEPNHRLLRMRQFAL